MPRPPFESPADGNALAWNCRCYLRPVIDGVWAERFAAPANRVTKALDALNKLLPNVLGFFNVVLPWFGRPALFIPPVPDFARWLPADENTPAPPGLVVLPPEPQPLPVSSDDPPPASDVPAGNPPAPETDA